MSLSCNEDVVRSLAITLVTSYLTYSTWKLFFNFVQIEPVTKMPYPISPFTDEFNVEILTRLNTERIGIQKTEEIELKKTLKWLCAFPKITSYRVNTLKTNKEEVLDKIHRYICKETNDVNIKVYFDSVISNVIIIENENIDSESLEKFPNEIIVDVNCAAAILRGANIYAPGILAMMTGTKLDDKVSIYADLSGKCKKGFSKLYDDPRKVFIGNGVVKIQRHKLFGKNLSPSGVGIEVTRTISGCPALGEDLLLPGQAILQNLPSIICVYDLDPQPNDVVLDMCASPGNKTTHIAQLMRNEGVLVALDKTPRKVDELKKRCEIFGAKVKTFQADSTKILAKNESDLKIGDGPPFAVETFDKILLDAPCSALGKRPQLMNATTEKIVKSYVPLQRKLIETAVKLLKPDGRLVYSTCTITLAENEGIVAWALQNFDCLEVIRPEMFLGSPGWAGTTLTDDQRLSVQRFGPDCEVDSVGFFIACLVKTKKSIGRT